MIEIAIPGSRMLHLEHLILDYNGTMACDGQLLEGVGKALHSLTGKIQIHVLTADTFGSVAGELQAVECTISVIPPDSQDAAKLDYINRLGRGSVVCIGNGRNDRLMLKEAALGIALIQEEGAAADTVLSADIVCTGISDALKLLLNPLRIAATLRC
jgi:soluble P-type ATPase